jgi:universal stress protein F
MYKTILVPVQIGDAAHGKAMIAMARKIGGKKARLIVAHVIEDIPAFVATNLPAGIMEKSKQSAVRETKALAKAADAAAEVEVRTGHAATTILVIAEDVGADLIIVGSHRPGLQDYLLGSTAARVVRHSNCSVLVAR